MQMAGPFRPVTSKGKIAHQHTSPAHCSHVRKRKTDRVVLCRLLPCETIQISVPSAVGPADRTAWLFDATDGMFLDQPASSSGCSGKRWQSWDTGGSTRTPASLRMPSSGMVTLVGAYVTSARASAMPSDAVKITAPISLTVDPSGDDAACAKVAEPAHGSTALPPLPTGMKAHGCLQSIAWLLLLFPVRPPSWSARQCGSTSCFW